MAHPLHLLQPLEAFAQPDWARTLRTLRYAGVVLESPTLEQSTLAAGLTQCAAAGLAVLAVRVSVDVNVPQLPAALTELAPRLAGTVQMLELMLMSSGEHDRPSAPRADGRAAELVKSLLALTTPRGLPVSLCPRGGNWLARVEDAVRLGMRVNRPNLGLTFSVADWLTTDGVALEDRLHLAVPRLLNLTLAGATRTDAGWQLTTLDATQFDWAAVVRQVRSLGYSGALSVRLPTALHGDPTALAATLATWSRWR